MTKTNDGIHVNKKYKDTVFRKLFGENKGNALSLYNAVNHTSYTNPDDLEYTTLEDVIYMKYKNDVSFLIDKTLSLYGHQSSYNPNMPLRGFLYYADLYRKLIHRSERLYSKHLLFTTEAKRIWKKKEGLCGYRMPLKQIPELVNMNGQPQ